MGDFRIDAHLVARLTPAVLAVLRGYRLGHEDRLDVVQSVWLLLITNVHTVRDPDRLVGWLRTAARREAIRRTRVAVREQRHWQWVVDGHPPRPSAEDNLLRRDRDRALWTVMARLPDRERRIAELLMSDPGMSCRCLAAHLGVSPSAAARARTRTLRKLRHLLAAEGITGP